MSCCDVLASDWGVSEYASCLWMFKLSGSHDKLDLPNINGVEALFRRVMAIEWQYREKMKDKSRGSISASSTVAGSAPRTSGEFDFFEGGGRTNMSLMVDPKLVEYIAYAMQKESDVSKSSRKAREEKSMAATGLSVEEVVGLIGKQAGGGEDGNAGGTEARASRRARRRLQPQ